MEETPTACWRSSAVRQLLVFTGGLALPPSRGATFTERKAPAAEMEEALRLWAGTRHLQPSNPLLLLLLLSDPLI